MISLIVGWFRGLEDRLKRAERQRIRKLEYDLAHARLALVFYARPNFYPDVVMRGHGGPVMADGGKMARLALRCMGAR
jgi:hypothetical protein